VKETKPVEGTKPVEETKPVEGTKPMEGTMPVKETKPVRTKPVEETKPACTYDKEFETAMFRITGMDALIDLYNESDEFTNAPTCGWRGTEGMYVRLENHVWTSDYLYDEEQTTDEYYNEIMNILDEAWKKTQEQRSYE